MSTVRIALANIRAPGTPDESVHLATSAIADAARRGACEESIYPALPTERQVFTAGR